MVGLNSSETAGEAKVTGLSFACGANFMMSRQVFWEIVIRKEARRIARRRVRFSTRVGNQ